MSYQTISNRMKEILQRIDKVHNVHTYFRDIPDEAEFEKAFKVELDEGNLLTAWMMTRTGMTVKRSTMSESILDVMHTIELQGLYALNDQAESEKDFQAIIDAILLKYTTKFLLESEVDGTTLSNILTTQPPQVSEIGHGTFSNYFVHFCRIIFTIEERVQ